jgi:hypothetical protein
VLVEDADVVTDLGQRSADQLLSRLDAQTARSSPVGVDDPVTEILDQDRLAERLQQLRQLRSLAGEDALAERHAPRGHLSAR